jgi:fumarate hydratase class I
LLGFLEERILALGTSACPPYHLAVVVGGLSAEHCLKTAKLASAHDLDWLPPSGNEQGRAFRDRDFEERLLRMTQRSAIGAQFGGKYFCHDVRVVRLPRHATSFPVAIAVSCSADRQARAKINADGVFLERMEEDPARFLPDSKQPDEPSVRVDLRRGMHEVRAQLSTLAVGSRVALTGPLIVARDKVHAALRDMLERGEDVPRTFKDAPIYYSGPAKTPQGYASGSFGPTTSARMDPYVAALHRHGASLVMVGKGHRTRECVDACRANGGFYLGAIGGAAALAAENHIRKAEVIGFEEFGMEAAWRIEVEDFPAFVVIDDKGNDFYEQLARTRVIRMP